MYKHTYIMAKIKLITIYGNSTKTQANKVDCPSLFA